MPKVAYEYAKALYELSCDTNEQNKYLAEIRHLRSILQGQPQLIEIMSSPVIKKNERLEVIDRIFSEHFSEYTVSFIKLLTERGRAKNIIECLNEFETLWYKNSNILIAKAVSAVPLTSEQKAQLHKNLEEKTGQAVELRVSTDPSLIGGMMITVNDVLTDGTVKGKLSQIKENLLKTQL